MKNISKLILFICFVLFNSLFAQTLTMGYRETAREPFIGKTGNNSGIYFDIYSAAAKKMNIDFKVVRLPKKRVLRAMKEGHIDFYPGFKFTNQRSKYIYYIKNGLLGGWNIGISLHSLPLITNVNQLKGIRVVTALGSPDANLLSKVKGVIVNSVNALDIKKTIALLRKERHQFYIDYHDTIKYYLKTYNIKDIKIHPDCCGKKRPMYFGFSRKSKNFEESTNPNYNNTLPISITNFPTIISKDSLAYKLGVTLNQMKENGEIQEIFDKYFN